MNVVVQLASFFESGKRVLTVSRKPDWKEYSLMAKITGIGIILIALIGYAITFLFKIFGIGY
ncbi:MAG: protein translocase SEC61 complex subunit gamma [archaeon]